MGSTRRQFSILGQICGLIPGHLVSQLSREYGVDAQSRDFTPWSHVVALVYAQMSHALGLNDVCDAMRNHKRLVRRIRGAVPPSRNGLSNANKVRSSAMAEALFWRVLGHLTSVSPGFGGRGYRGFPRRFRKNIHVVDSTTLKLVANCVDWARHKRSKAGAKVHMRLDLKSFLPAFAIVDTARPNDNARAREMCADLKRSEIVIFDKAYYDFLHLADLQARGVYWVTRAKSNLRARCVKRLQRGRQGAILRDDLIVLSRPTVHEKYPHVFRRVTALVDLKGVPTEMVFLTNHLEWAPSTIADLYKSRWAIEAFFKQLKQTLQLATFLGHSKNAIQWQVWTALLAYVLLRYLAFISQWNHSFSRIVTVIRATLWSRLDLFELLRSYGIAGGSFRLLYAQNQLLLPGFAPD